MDDVQNDGLADDDLLAGGEQSNETDEDTLDTDSDAETTDDTPEGDEPEGDEDGDKDDDEPKRKKRSGSERLKRQNERLQRELAELRQGRPAAPAAGDEAAIERAVEEKIGKPPKPEDFESYLEYEQEMTAYRLDKRQATRDVKADIAKSETSSRERLRELSEDHVDRLEALEKALPGSRKVIQSMKGEVSEHVGQLVLESDKSHLLALHIAKNPELLDELNAMSPTAAARKVGHLEARLSLPKPKTETKAPPPVRPLKGAATPSNPSNELDAWLKTKYGR